MAQETHRADNISTIFLYLSNTNIDILDILSSFPANSSPLDVVSVVLLTDTFSEDYHNYSVLTVRQSYVHSGDQLLQVKLGMLC